VLLLRKAILMEIWRHTFKMLRFVESYRIQTRTALAVLGRKRQSVYVLLCYIARNKRFSMQIDDATDCNML
jgi:hypothetical protein